MPKQKRTRKPGRPRLGGVVVKARLSEETAEALRTRAAALVRPAGSVVADAVEAYLRAV